MRCFVLILLVVLALPLASAVTYIASGTDLAVIDNQTLTYHIRSQYWTGEFNQLTNKFLEDNNYHDVRVLYDAEGVVNVRGPLIYIYSPDATTYYNITIQFNNKAIFIPYQAPAKKVMEGKLENITDGNWHTIHYEYEKGRLRVQELDPTQMKDMIEAFRITDCNKEYQTKQENRTWRTG